jgi:hypothetical protein
VFQSNVFDVSGDGWSIMSYSIVMSLVCDNFPQEKLESITEVCGGGG